MNRDIELFFCNITSRIVTFCVLQVRLITDKVTGKPKGYAFIEYMHKRDMKGLFQLI